MVSFSLWTEVTMSGFFYLLGLFFLILKFVGAKDLSFFSTTKDYMALIVILVVFVSYILGLIAHRMLQILVPPAIRLPGRLFKRKKSINPDIDKSIKYNVLIFQHGSEKLQRELDWHFSLFTLFTSLIFSVPFVGLTSFLWLTSINLQDLGLPILIACVTIGIFCVIIDFRQRRNYYRLKDEAVLQLQDLLKKKFEK